MVNRAEFSSLVIFDQVDGLLGQEILNTNRIEFLTGAHLDGVVDAERSQTLHL